MFKKLLKNKLVLVIAICLLIALICFISYFKFIAPSITIKSNVSFEINSEHKINELIKNTKNIKLTNKESKINTSKIGKQNIIIKYNKKIGKGSKEVTVNIVDTTKPTIEYEKELTTTKGVEIDLLENIKVTDNSKEDIEATVEGEYDFNKAGTYNLKYIAKDSSGNETIEDFKLIVTESKISKQTTTKSNVNNKNPYYTEIVRNKNVVIIYGLDANNEYTKIIKVFPCSVGLNDGTPTGTFTTSAGQRWHALFGNVFGQYTTRITGHILFHSVPYTSQSPDTLETEEYNKLGQAASMGCIRMRVADVKWIYDNCPKGMTVKIYDGELPAGVSKPSAEKIDVNSPNKGWDPTDPDPNNPWK